MKLINKAAVVARIEEGIKEYSKAKKEYPICEEYYEGALDVLEDFKDKFLNTLEVKEVDLDTDIRTYLTNHFNIYEDGVLQSKKSGLPLRTYDIIKVAEHFFELGMQQSKNYNNNEE